MRIITKRMQKRMHESSKFHRNKWKKLTREHEHGNVLRSQNNVLLDFQSTLAYFKMFLSIL